MDNPPCIDGAGEACAAWPCGIDTAAYQGSGSLYENMKLCGLSPEIMRALELRPLAGRCRETGLDHSRAARHLSDLLELSEESIILVDDAWRIVELNRRAERLFALSGDA